VLKNDRPAITNPDDRLLSAYDYELPPAAIAQNPVEPRDHSRLLYIQSSQSHEHRRFYELADLLKPGDLLVLNNTRVIPARLFGLKPSGAKVEVLLLEQQGDRDWLALVKPGKRLKVGAKILFISPEQLAHNSPDFALNTPSQLTPDALSIDASKVAENHSVNTSTRAICNTSSPNSSKIERNNPTFVESDQSEVSQTPEFAEFSATVIGTDTETGGRILRFEYAAHASFFDLLDRYGEIPFPPYVTESQAAPDRYQTVYAEREGSAAAPTAGLHFTEDLFQRLEKRGIQRTFITLHVGVGTFRPVEVEDITTHAMHGEWIEVTPEAVATIERAKRQGGRVIAVGTTAVRSLESAAISGTLQPYSGKTELFIYPGYRWQVVEGLITNFHLPKSSLMMLVSAAIGRERLLSLYQEAIIENYRFFSFGDAMLIDPKAFPHDVD